MQGLIKTDFLDRCLLIRTFCRMPGLPAPTSAEIAKSKQPRKGNCGKCLNQDAGCKMQDAGYGIQDTGSRIQDLGYRIQDTGYRIQDTGYRMYIH